MTFTAAVKESIIALGGSIRHCEGDLWTCLQGVQFTGDLAQLLFADWAEYTDAQVLEQINLAPQRARELITHPPFIWDPSIFTPFTVGTGDHEEWAGTIEPDGLATLCGHENPEVIFIGHSQGWPNYFFVVAQDPHPENPKVYATDHEVYFREVEELGTLDEFLRSLLTPTQFDVWLATTKLVAAGWEFEPVATSEGTSTVGFSQLQGTLVDWCSSFSMLSAPDGSVWFLSLTDYNSQLTDSFAWNFIEELSLQAATSASETSEITKFWRTHLPILLCVRGTYAYLAVRNDGVVVHGEGPVFEETTVVAVSIEALLHHLGTRPTRGQGLIEHLVFGDG